MRKPKTRKNLEDYRKSSIMEFVSTPLVLDYWAKHLFNNWKDDGKEWESLPFRPKGKATPYSKSYWMMVARVGFEELLDKLERDGYL